MGELTLTSFLTLDGISQAPGGPTEDTSGGFPYGGWLVPHADTEMGAIMIAIFEKAGAFLLGRRTYDIFAGHWPKVTDSSDVIANKLNSLPKYVASRTRTKFDWGETTEVSDASSAVAEIKQRRTSELQVHGSCDLAQTLIEQNLIDEFRLLTFPVILGKGKRLFGAGVVPACLKLISTRATSKGAVFSVYRRGEAFEVGSFALT